MLEKIEAQVLNCSEQNLRIKRWDQVNLSDQSSAIRNRFTPGTFDYYLELNPSFVSNYFSLENMSEYPVIMFRDGYIGIFYFFAKYPKPLENLETVLLIPKEFSDLVTSFWKNNVLFYSIENTQSIERIEQVENVYVYGALTLDNFINKRIPESVDELRKLIPKNAKVSIMSSFKHIHFLDGRNEIETAINFQKEIYKKFGFEIEHIDEYDTELFQSAGPNCAFVDLDQDNFIFYDNYLNHYFSSRGAINLRQGKSKQKNVIKTIKLSPYHQLNIESSDDKAFSFNIREEIANIRVKSIPIQYTHNEFYQHVRKIFKSRKY